jgi:phosphoheptose isomerase
MACGTPVIGSDVGGIKYTVVDGETGYLVAPRDPDELADRLEKLYRNPDQLKRFSRKALQRANQLFTWNRVSGLLADIYEEVCAQDQAERLVPVDVNAAARFPASPATLSQQAISQQAITQAFGDAYRTMRRAQSALGEPVLKAAELMIACLSSGGKILVCGNGGSAAEAQHFAAELVGRYKLPNRSGLPVQALTADSATLTAWANDVGYEYVYARQVEAFGHPGDLLLGISTSGQSKNIVAAIQAARGCGMTSVALTGKDGGEIGSLADMALIVPSQQTERIQEVHLLILHVLCELIEKSLVRQPAFSSSYLLPVMPPIQPAMVKKNGSNSKFSQV